MKKDEKIPEFKTLEEEREYWEARGPLAPGNRGRIHKPVPGQKHSSFLAVRMTGTEITKLRDIAAKRGLGISTYARILLTEAIEKQTAPEAVTLNEIKDMLENLLDRTPALGPARASEKKTKYKV
jgi:hypothetical protein